MMVNRIDVSETAAAPGLQRLESRLMPLRSALLDHPIYAEIRNLDSLRCFMEHHVFAVWDFMSLLKALQGRFCSVGVPWLPPVDAGLARFVNEIVLAEESDEDGRGGYTSHFALYRRSMIECGADTRPIDAFVEQLRSGTSVERALDLVAVPECVRRFVRQTFSFIEGESVPALAAAFTFGREDLLPGLFHRVVEEVGSQAGRGLDDFRYYLYRHIGLDGDEHGPLARRLMQVLCGTDDVRWLEAEQAALRSLQGRCDLWDGACAKMTAAR